MPVVTLPVAPDGPIVPIILHLSRPRVQLLKTAQHAVPPSMTGRGLIDTGASKTAIDSSVVQTLGLVATGVSNMLTPSTGPIPYVCNQYDISLGIVLLPKVHVASWEIPVVEARLLNQGQGIHALLGRDVLAGGMIAYNGKTNTFSIAF